MDQFRARVLVLAATASILFAASDAVREKKPSRANQAAALSQKNRTKDIWSGSASVKRSPAAAAIAPRDRNISLPILFEPSRGQGAPGVQFLGRGKGLNAALTGDGFVLRVPQRRGPAQAADAALAIRLRGRSGFDWRGGSPQAGESNYFIGNDPRKWRTHVRHFGRAETQSVHGLGLAVYGDGANVGDGIEYDIRVAPRMDPAAVRLDLRGAKGLHLAKDGSLQMRVGGRELRMKAPTIYEEQIAMRSVDTPKGPRRNRRSASSRGPTPRAGGGTYRGTNPSLKSGTYKGSARRRTPSPRRNARGARAHPSISRSPVANGEERKLRKSLNDTPQPRRRRKRKAIDIPGLIQQGGGANPTSGSDGISKHEQGHTVPGGYVLEADGSVGVWVGAHDPAKELVIDPSISIATTYETFLGGTGTDAVTSVTEDAAGNVYLAGTTTSAETFPEGANATFQTERGATQLFLAKISFTSGIGTLQYLTFFGGSLAQAGGQLAVDSSGNAAILGVTTSTDYPVTDGSVATAGLTGGSGNDLTVSEVDPTGANLIFSTLFGGSGSESLNATSGIALNASENIPGGSGGIAFDATGNIYVASDTTSLDLPTTSGALQPAFGGESKWDGFLVEFSPLGVEAGTAEILYCSYLGTNADGPVGIGGVAVDTLSPANVYVAGFAGNGVDAFPSKGAFQASYGGGTSDGFLMKILPLGAGATDLVYATELGGANTDEALAVAVDGANPANAYVVGLTQSLSFPAAPLLAGPNATLHAPLGSHAPSPQNAFLAVVGMSAATQMTSLKYFTYAGGTQADAAQAVEALSPEEVYVGGTTTSWDFGWHDNVQPFNGGSDAFVAKFDSTVGGAASMMYATPLGGTFSTPGAPVRSMGNGIAADAQGHIYVGGATTAADFPTAVTTGSSMNGFQETCTSCGQSPVADATLVAMQEGTAPQPAVSFGSGSLSFGTAGIPVGSPAGAPVLFGIVNSGAAPLLITSAAVAGANAADFSVTSSCPTSPQTLASGASCQGSVNFTPSVPGTEGAVIAFTDNAPGSPQFIEVTGVGAGPVSIAPASFSFGSQPVNSAGAATVTFTAGALAVQNFTVTESGANESAFGKVSICGSANIPSGGTCALVYQFLPASVGSFSAVLTLNYQLAGQPATYTQALPMTGTGIPAAPAASVRPGALQFGSAMVGASTAAQTVIVANTGSALLGFTQAVQITGQNAADFSQTNTCAASLAPAASCTAAVKFTPQNAGAKTATLVVTDNVTGSPQTVTLTATATANSVPQAQVLPPSWGFAPQSLGSTSAPEPVTITNTGTVLLSFSKAIAITGADPADFTQTNNCPQALGAGAQCTVNVSFAPTAGGDRTASLTIADNAPGGQQSVALNGTGLVANATVSPAIVTFGGQQAGTASAALPVTLTSNGPGQPLKITSIALSGANAADFSESDNCIGSSVTSACTIQVKFLPACVNESAARTATLTVLDNSATSPHNVTLNGTATGDFCVRLPTSGTSLTVAAGGTANFPAVSLVSVSTFTGNVNLSCASSPVVPSCTILPSATTAVSPGTAGQFEIQVPTFTTTTASVAPHPTSNWPPGPAAAIAAGILLLLNGLRSRNRRTVRFAQATFVFTLIAAGIAACGGNVGGGGDAVPSDPPIATGTYTLTVTASEGSETLPVTLTLIVNQ